MLNLFWRFITLFGVKVGNLIKIVLEKKNIYENQIHRNPIVSFLNLWWNGDSQMIFGDSCFKLTRLGFTVCSRQAQAKLVE